MNKKEMLEEFDANATMLLSLEKMTSGLLQALISQEGIQIHSLTHRIKQRESLGSKISRPDKSYKNLLDITDIVGFRLTTYFSEDVDNIANLIDQEFSIDIDNSIDKRKALEPDRFGYMSLHLVVQHNDSRLKLAEYKQFGNIKFEIQIRSILQHAWAEIEHDIGYKSTKEIPVELRRRFSRLAGLLELADEEFQSIKNGIESYRLSLPQQIEATPSEVLLNLESLTYYIKNDRQVNLLERKMLKELDCEALTEVVNIDLSNRLEFLNRMNILTLGELIEKYEKISKLIIPFMKLFLIEFKQADNQFRNIKKGISLLYLTYINLAMNGDKKHSEYVLSATSFHNMDTSTLVEKVHNTWAELKKDPNI